MCVKHVSVIYQYEYISAINATLCNSEGTPTKNHTGSVTVFDDFFSCFFPCIDPALAAADGGADYAPPPPPSFPPSLRDFLFSK